MHDRKPDFDPRIPIEEASTPPSSWYVDPLFYRRERREVFRRTWQAVARLDQLRQAGDYVSGTFCDEPYIVLRDGDGELRAFFNVCRHHATCLVEGEGRAEQLVCPYHGWTYDLDGRLRKAPRLGGVRQFDRQAHGLIPLDVGSWGPLVFVRIERDGPSLEEELRPLEGRVDCSGLRFVARKSWEIACNWKVFVDNYLDGGYHVSYLHKGLAGQLDLASYRTEIIDRMSLQVCGSGDGETATGGSDFKERLGEGAVYAYVYPNLMLNRYGPILDTNWVVPLSHERTLTVFDYYFETDRVDDAFVERSLEASERVQQEDIDVCEAVQRGLASSGFDRGRYAPTVEQAAYHFHGLLAADLGRGPAGSP